MKNCLDLKEVEKSVSSRYNSESKIENMTGFPGNLSEVEIRSWKIAWKSCNFVTKYEKEGVA